MFYMSLELTFKLKTELIKNTFYFEVFSKTILAIRIMDTIKLTFLKFYEYQIYVDSNCMSTFFATVW